MSRATYPLSIPILGLESLNPPPLDLNVIYRDETVSTEPILLLVGNGADPSQELNELANKVVGAHRFHQIAMGQSQESTLLELLRRCMEQGDWLCLYNIHLAVSLVAKIQNVGGGIGGLQPCDIQGIGFSLKSVIL